MFYDSWKNMLGHDNCSFVVTMDSPLACRTNISSADCTIVTGSGAYNFTDLARTPKTVSVCVCVCWGVGLRKIKTNNKYKGGMTCSRRVITGRGHLLGLNLKLA